MVRFPSTDCLLRPANDCISKLYHRTPHPKPGIHGPPIDPGPVRDLVFFLGPGPVRGSLP